MPLALNYLASNPKKREVIEMQMAKLNDAIEIRRLSAELFEKQRAGSAGGGETTPTELSAELAAFCTTLGAGKPEFVPVVADPHGIYGFCSDGVEGKVNADGGRAIFGWCVWEWPAVLWTAEFHAIWQAPDGIRSDITPKPGGETSILFVPDLSYPPDFNFDHRPGNKRRRAYPDQDRSAIAAAKVAALKPVQRSYEEERARRVGVPLEVWMERKVPNDPIPALLDSFLTSCDEHEAYFDTLAVSGPVAPDRKLVELNNRRVALQRQLRPLLKQRGLG